MNKGYLESKTLWASLITALIPLFPEVEALVIANPKLVMTGVGVAFSILRMLTSKKLGK